MNEILPRHAAEPGIARPRVLVVDDDRVTRQVMVAALTRDGFDAVEAADATLALAEIERRRPAVVLMDVEMPGMNGFEACETIRRRWPEDDLQVLMVTGNDDAASIERAYRAGTSDFISKPINLPMLGHRLRHLLRTREAMHALADAVAELDRNRERLHELAFVDTLTGLPNRDAFLQRMEDELERCRAAGESLAVMFLDVDNFKRVNDTLGHASGDELLATMAARLRRAVQQPVAMGGSSPRTGVLPEERTMVARLGGDEFTVMLSGPEPGVTAELAARLVRVLNEPMRLGGHELVVSPSIGIAMCPEHGTDAGTLLRHADAAMYAVKRDGRNGFRFHEDSVEAGCVDALTLESRLRRALRDDALSLEYQPQLDVESGAIIGVEALLRWHDADIGAVAPDVFVPVAERSGLILPIGRWVLETACRNMAGWLEDGLGLDRVAVNISVRQFVAGDFVEQVAEVLRTSGLPPAALELEITESLLMEDVEGAIRTMAALKALGVEIAIDDFGTGYSSLGYLKRFPIDRLKIDRIFVRDILSDGDDAAITRAVIAMAHSMDLSVVAEGVESEEQLHFLARLDCEQVQGYHLSRPLPPARIPAFLRERAALTRAA